MALAHSTGLKTFILGTGFKTSFDTTGRLLVYSGAAPASADTAPTGTLLATETLPATSFGAAGTPAGGITMAGTPLTVNAVATGTAGYFRLQLSGDLGTTNTTDRRLQGTCTVTGGGGDMTFDNVNLTTGSPVNLTSFVYSAAP